MITSVKNPRVQQAVKLRDRRGRERAGLTIIDGLREIRQGLEHGIEMVTAFVCAEDAASESCRELASRLEQAGAQLLPVSAHVYDKLAFGQRREGMVAVARTREQSLSDLQPIDASLIAVLDALEKPGNIGAILRSADGAGVQAVILTST